jgi:hypothetical protein
MLLSPLRSAGSRTQQGLMPLSGLGCSPTDQGPRLSLLLPSSIHQEQCGMRLEGDAHDMYGPREASA